MTDYSDGPPVLRPVPRRPFGLSLREPSPPDEDSFPPTPDTDSPLNLDSLNSRLLDPRRRNNNHNNNAVPSPSESDTLSRAQSVLNLTSSTLMGIYAPTTYGRDRFYAPGDELTTPWGTGAETPATREFDIDRVLGYELQKERTATSAHRTSRRRSSLHPVIHTVPPSKAASILYLGLRGVLLSGLGMLCGLLVAQVQDRQRSVGAFRMESIVGPSGCDWRYMAFWAASGLVLGSLLPWFDGVWEGAFGGEEVVDIASEAGDADKEPGTGAGVGVGGTDWALAVRGIGMFVGIAFAIRKLPWDSTLQVSLTLALVNPVLWFLIDRSVPGFVVSSAVGLTGSAVLMGLQPDMVPIPTINGHSSSSPSAFGGLYNPNNGHHHNSHNNSSYAQQQEGTPILGGLATQETLATGIWMLNVLFCCCVCFGNIGRWLALNRSASTKGRWAERR
ncbi:Uu.00g082430.m01.CDS01 [Anthostomella pinea]|uniref:Uu.00g082430.m01.CDS01 n=1 Tax=Anthostomella pinea TaxID=933095 RepID=A0AAI8VM04_9PEZI|nr:Uu.00g082430.m01.CDS01 [Anthostomella pinea]